MNDRVCQMHIIILAKQTLSKEDMARISSNHDNFCRMSNTLEVIIRLYSRGAISQRLRERLVHMYNDKGQMAASGNILLLK